MNCFEGHQQQTPYSFDTIAVMRSQEENADYQTQDFLVVSNDMVSFIDIDTDCRSKMCAWCYQVADFCKFNRESVEIALSYLDRYMLSTSGQDALQSRNTYQLASMTCLYMAIKIHERQAMSPDVISQLSQGTYTPLQVEQMEALILNALKWRMNPPTSTSFARELLATTHLTPREHEVSLELARLQCEVATSAYHLIATPRSVIALAAVMNALESLGTIKRTKLYQIRLTMEQALGMTTVPQLDKIRSFLYESLTVSPRSLLKAPGASKAVPDNAPANRRASWTESPRSVSDHNLQAYHDSR